MLSALAACGSPPWSDDEPSVVPAAPASATSADPSPTPTPSAKSDLASGSVKHTLTAGGIEVVVTYYSDLPQDRWTAAATKPLKVSLTSSFPDGSKQDIYLRGLKAQVDVTGAAGPLAGVGPLEDRAEVEPGYLVRRPNSYSTVLSVPPLDAGARAVTLTLTYELLAQSAPKAKTYLKQTASDTLQLTIAGA